MIRRPPRSTPKPSSAASDVYKRQVVVVVVVVVVVRVVVVVVGGFSLIAPVLESLAHVCADFSLLAEVLEGDISNAACLDVDGFEAPRPSFCHFGRPEGLSEWPRGRRKTPPGPRCRFGAQKGASEALFGRFRSPKKLPSSGPRGPRRSPMSFFIRYLQGIRALF